MSQQGQSARSVSLQKRVLIPAAVLFAATVVLAGVTLWTLANLGSQQDNQALRQTPLLHGAAMLLHFVAEDRAAQASAVTAALRSDMAQQEKAARDAEEARREQARLLDELGKLVSSAEERTILATLESALTEMSSASRDIAAALGRGDSASAAALLGGRSLAAREKADPAAEALVALVFRELNEADRAFDSRRSLVQWTSFVLLLLSVAAGAALVYVVRSTGSSLRRIVGELDASATQLGHASSQVATSSQGLAQGASEQAASLEESSASSEEVNSMACSNSERSSEAAGLVGRTGAKITDANRKLEQLVAAMAEINTQSDKISRIIRVIDEIAFQTNILALNAAVEAARAGQHGMGFAVVADEVRNLAQRCAQAARDTTELIELSVARSKDGRTRVEEVAAAISEITAGSTRIQELIGEVNLGSQEQTRGIDQIARAIAQLQQATQHNAASAEQGSAAAQELDAQSSSLRGVVTRLSVLVNGA